MSSLVRFRSAILWLGCAASLGCLGPEVEQAPGSPRALTPGLVLGSLEDGAIGRRCGAVLIAPRVAVTAKSCLAGATADRLRFRWGGFEAGAVWQYYRGPSASPFVGDRLEDVEAVLLDWEVPEAGLPVAVPRADGSEGFVALDATGAAVPPDDVTISADRLTLRTSLCPSGLAPGDPILQAGALVAIVSGSTGPCEVVATTVAERGPVLSALSKAEEHRARTTQWHEIRNDAIHARTEVVVLAEPARVLAALEGVWSRWWLDGVVSGHGPTDDGGVQFDLRPVRPMPTRVHVWMSPPRSTQAASGRDTILIDVTLAGHFVGPARWEIEDAGTPDEPRSIVRSIWDGVAATGAFSLATGAAAQMHMWAEGGKLPGRRTGVPGLIDYLERWQDTAL